MAKNTGHKYKIDLDISTPQASKQALKEFERALERGDNSVEDINKTFVEMSRHVNDVERLQTQYNKAIAKRLSLNDEVIDKINAEKVAISATVELTQKQKKDIIEEKDAHIERLEKEKAYIKAKQKEAQLMVKTQRLFKDTADQNSKSFRFMEKIVRAQEKLNALLGKESRLRKAMSAAKGVAAKGVGIAANGVKAAGAAMAGVAAIGAAATGAIASSANDIAQKDQALRSLKGGISPSIVDEVYIKSGADYASIVAAINNLSTITKESGTLVQAAVLELQNPGIGRLLLSSTQRSGDDVLKLERAIAQIKKQTGVQDLTPAIEASLRDQNVTRGTISQSEYLQAYSALSLQGLDEETIDRIIRSNAKKSGNFIENLNRDDLSKYARDGQSKTRLSNVSLNLSAIDTSQESEKTAASSLVEKMRALEIKKNELLVRLFPVVDKLLTTLEKSGVIDTLADTLVTLITNVAPALAPIFDLLKTVLVAIAPVIKPIAKGLEWIATGLKALVEKIIRLIENLPFWGSGDDKDKIAEIPISARAQGGIVNTPSLCGERGAELIVPLEYSRAGRAQQIITNYNTTQHFNMHKTQTTPLAFASAIGNNRFISRFAPSFVGG